MTGPTPPVFSPTGPLPTGTTVLEASAGTGKTSTIAALATRYVAEGQARLDELMLVTFGREATAELRGRVRERLVHTVEGLQDPDAARQSDDQVLAQLARADDGEVEARRGRLVTALAGFDAATIATTHGFCHQMLAGLGVTADVDADAALTESVSDLVTDTVTDLYVRSFGLAHSRPAELGFAAAAQVAAQAVGDPSARLEPTAAEPGSLAAVRVGLARAVRAEVDRRKRLGRVLDYDDLLLRLRDALADEVTGRHARERIRGRYRVVLVDEFQDTDPVQWDILRLTFHGHRTLVLVGDPKQAIYAFRGADVVTYLLAREDADHTATLGTTWRSDAGLAGALDRLLGGVALGDPRITAHPVVARHGRRLHGSPDQAPLRVRVVTRHLVEPDRHDRLPAREVRRHVARDLALDVVALLRSGATLSGPAGPGRAVQPGDVAVLVQRNQDGRTVRDALQRAGVPVVLTGTSSVFGSTAATDWLTFLRAVEQPHRAGLVRSAALTTLVGWTAADLAGDEQRFEDLAARFRSWSQLLATRGVAALLEAVSAASALPARALATTGGERQLTDLDHVGQALHVAAVRSQLGVASLVAWLQRRIREAAGDADVERSRRLESDADAVQVVTVHRSKGLEFPVVYAPFLTLQWVADQPDPLRIHDEDGARVLDVGGPQGPGYPGRRARCLAEDAGESLRLAYVALTRARSQVVTWWAPTAITESAPLHRLLFGDRDADGALPLRVPVPSDADVHARLTALAAESAGQVSVAPATLGDPARWTPPAAERPSLAARRLTRGLDTAWTRTSYSGLTAGLHEAGDLARPLSEPEAPGTLDEPALPAAVPLDQPPPDALPSPMADLPVGAAFGTLVHSVLENLDFTAPDLRAALLDRCADAEPERFAGVAPRALADALLPALSTPLGPLAHGRALTDIPPSDVLAEMAFEYPLSGGDHPSGSITVADVGRALAGHLDDEDPLRAYADDLTAAALQRQPLRGFVGGFVDAVLRVRDHRGVPRYLVVDYKTNRLGDPSGPLTSWHYRPEALARAMRQAHYPLQSLLYTVALHRYLRWRQPGYDPDLHLGGTLYLFLRGMCGPDTPAVGGVPAGVFSWRAPAGLVTDLSVLLDGGAR